MRLHTIGRIQVTVLTTLPWFLFFNLWFLRTHFEILKCTFREDLFFHKKQYLDTNCF